MASVKLTILAFAVLFLRTAAGQTSANYCSLLVDVISICEIETPGFTDLPATQQVSCLCGSTIGTIPWGPATFDGLASECAVEYATIDVTVAYDASELAGLCTVAAAQPTIASSTTNTGIFSQSTGPQTTAATSTAANTGLFSVSTDSGTATVISIMTVTQTSDSLTTSNAAVRGQLQGQELLGLGLAMGGFAVGGGYAMA